MNTKLAFLCLILAIFAIWIFSRNDNLNHKTSPIITPQKPDRTWIVKSIDTMKYSRDLSLEKLSDPTFNQTIDSQMRAIKDEGANYVAIATPYDEKFMPILSRWVDAARSYNLNIWFRGNFSGWEGWFGESRSLSRQQHLDMTRAFIQNHSNLFRNGDIFSPCPECENGGPGDPRSNGDVEGFRQFMIDEHKASDEEFQKIGKTVITNFASMNYDVANLVMDHSTTVAMGNLIVIDHYVNTPEKLSSDLDNLVAKTQAKIFLGEFGAPIPDITGDLNPEQQSSWIDSSLGFVAKKPNVIGVNYWVSVGGQTAIFNDDNTKKPAADVLKKYFKLTKLD